MVRIIILYTLFSATNNTIYHAIEAALSGLIFAICFVPRLSNKHYALLLTFICFMLLTLATAATLALLIQKYLINHIATSPSRTIATFWLSTSKKTPLLTLKLSRYAIQ